MAMANHVKLSAADLNNINNRWRRPLQPANHKDSVLKKLRTQGEEYPDKKRGAALMTPAILPPGDVRVRY